LAQYTKHVTQSQTKTLTNGQVKAYSYDRWIAYIPAKYDAALRQDTKEIAFTGKTEREAVAKRTEYIHEQRSKTNKTQLSERTSLGDYIREVFFDAHEADMLADNRTYDYICQRRSRLTRYTLTRPLAALRLNHLQPEDIDEYFASLKRERISISLRRNLRIDVRHILHMAKRYLPCRPADYFAGIKLPMPVREEPKLFDYDTVKAKIENPTLPLYARTLVAFQLHMQCRPSQIWALQWSHIDLKAGTVTYAQTLRKVKREDGTLAYMPTKGDKRGNVRTFPLTAVVADLLRTLHKTHMQSTMPPKYVFDVQTKGEARRAQEHALEDLNLTGATFYSLKHLGNSYALAHGATVNAQAQRMGHASTRMATEVYRRVFYTEHDQVNDIFDQGYTRSTTYGSDRILG
jgi:integrase